MDTLQDEELALKLNQPGSTNRQEHPPNDPPIYSNTDFRSYSNTESSSRGRSNVPPVHVHPDREREHLADDIKENSILQNIDREIEYVADNIRRQTIPPQTQEFLDDDNDDPSLGPYDPNLVCNGCGMRYRYGELGKLRRHINEFCVSLKYTGNQQPWDNDCV